MTLENTGPTENQTLATTGRRAVRFLAQRRSLSRLAGLAMTGERAACWLSDDELIAESGSLRSAARRHLPLVVHLASGLSTGHGAYHASGDAGCFQMYAADAQEAADFSLIAHRIAELSLSPGIVAQDAPATTDSLVSLRMPSDQLADTYLGRPEDLIDTPTPAQVLLFGDKRRRLPELWAVDRPMMTGAAHGPDSRGERTAANAPFFLAHLPELRDRAFREFSALSGRTYGPIGAFAAEDADYLIVAQGSTVRTAEALAEQMRGEGTCRLGVVNARMLRPFPGEQMCSLLLERKGVLVLERTALVLREDSSLTRAIRTTLAKKARHNQTPPLFTAFLNLGDPQARPGALLAAVENMMSGGGRKVQLSVAFTSPTAPTPQQEIQQNAVCDAYPDAARLYLPDAKTPPILPEGTLAIRLHGLDALDLSRSGEGLARDAANLFALHLNARAEDKGTLYHIGLAPETLKTGTSESDADVTFLLDARAGAGAPRRVKKGGAIVVQSKAEDPAGLWSELTHDFKHTAAQRDLRVFFADIHGCAEMAGRDKPRVLLGCLLAVLPETVTSLNADQLKGVLRDPSVKQGRDSLCPAPLPEPAPVETKEPSRPAIPAFLRTRPREDVPAADIHRFFAQTGHRYSTAAEPRNLADPFVGSGLVPGATGILRDHSANRTEHPVLVPEKCTGCGDCWMVCPDSALPSRVNDVSEVIETAFARLRSEGHALHFIDDSLHTLAETLTELLEDKQPAASFNDILNDALVRLAQEAPRTERERLEHELDILAGTIEKFPLVVTERFFHGGKGGLLSIGIDPARCKGCLACVRECPESALTAVRQTKTSLASLQESSALASALPDSGDRHIRDIDASSDDGKGYDTLLLKRNAYEAVTGGHDGAPGSAAHTLVHIFAAAAAGILQARLTRRLAGTDALIERLEEKVRLGLAVDVEDSDALHHAMDSFAGDAFTLAQLSEKLDLKKDPVDTDWLRRSARTLSTLKHWRSSADQYARLGAVLGGETESSRYPYHPFSFPCTRLGSGQSPEMALGIFEGHMKKMAGTIAAFRIAQLEVDAKYNPKIHDAFFRDLSWKDFTDEELRLCPPVVIIVGARDLYGPGWGALSGLLGEGVPIKILVLDSLVTPAHSALTAMVHPDVFILQGGMGDPQRLMRGFVEGLSSKRPALFNIYRSTIAEDEGGSPFATQRAREALRSRAVPMFTFDPDRSAEYARCLDLDGNPELDAEWVEYEQSFVNDNGEEESLRVPYTFADFAAGERPFESHFTPVARQQWTKNMVPIAEYLHLDADDRAESVPFISSVDGAGRLERFRVSPDLVQACARRLAVWNTLKRIKRLDITEEEAVAARVRAELIDTVTKSLVEIAG